MADIEALIKQLGQLTVVEALELSKKLSKEWNIDLDNLQASANAPAVEAKPADAPVSVILTGFGENKKIPVLKKVREFTSLGLLEAKQFVEGLPKPVKENIDKEEAEKIKAALEEQGGTVEIK